VDRATREYLVSDGWKIAAFALLGAFAVQTWVNWYYARLLASRDWEYREIMLRAFAMLGPEARGDGAVWFVVEEELRRIRPRWPWFPWSGMRVRDRRDR
jgi:hypothetical protein